MLIPGYNDIAVPPESTKMAKVNLFTSERMFVDYYVLLPGQSQAPHTHDGNDKLYYVLEGAGMFLLGEAEHELGAGRGCVAAASVPHGVRNHTQERLVLLVSMAPHP